MATPKDDDDESSSSSNAPPRMEFYRFSETTTFERMRDDLNALCGWGTNFSVTVAEYSKARKFDQHGTEIQAANGDPSFGRGVLFRGGLSPGDGRERTNGKLGSVIYVVRETRPDEEEETVVVSTASEPDYVPVYLEIVHASEAQETLAGVGLGFLKASSLGREIAIEGTTYDLHRFYPPETSTMMMTMTTMSITVASVKRRGVAFFHYCELSVVAGNNGEKTLAGLRSLLRLNIDNMRFLDGNVTFTRMDLSEFASSKSSQGEENEVPDTAAARASKYIALFNAA